MYIVLKGMNEQTHKKNTVRIKSKSRWSEKRRCKGG